MLYFNICICTRCLPRTCKLTTTQHHFSRSGNQISNHFIHLSAQTCIQAVSTRHKPSSPPTINGKKQTPTPSSHKSPSLFLPSSPSLVLPPFPIPMPPYLQPSPYRLHPKRGPLLRNTSSPPLRATKRAPRISSLVVNGWASGWMICRGRGRGC